MWYLQRWKSKMTREQLEHQRESVEAQLRWAILHDGDEELLDLLRFESDRLSSRLGQMSLQFEEVSNPGVNASKSPARRISNSPPRRLRSGSRS